jgi:hypothetical protein
MNLVTQLVAAFSLIIGVHLIAKGEISKTIGPGLFGAISLGVFIALIALI